MQSIPRLACVAISFALALASQFGTPRAQTYAAGVDYKAGELVLTFKPEYMPAQNEVTLSPPSFGVSPLDAMLSAIQATSISKVVPSYEAVSRLERQFLVTYTEEDDPLELIGEFAALEYFESVAANRLWWFELQGTERAVPGDTTLFAQQWYLDNSDVGDKSDIDAPEAWAIERGDPNLVVGIYDSGTMVDPCTGTNWRLHSDFNHLFVPGEDKFPFNILTQADFLNDTVDDDSDGFLGNVIGVNVGDGCDPLLCTDQTPLTIWRPLPQNWIVGTSFPNLECPGASASWDVVGFHTHGVRVGAIAVAKWDGLKKNHPEDLDPTHKDIVGVANNCKVYNARFRCPTGDAQAAAALVALAEHCSVINMSFGQREYDLFSGFSNSFKDAVEKVTSDPSYDCVLVAATGNSGLGNDIIYPARFDSVLAVGAISRYDLNDAPNPQRVDYSNYSEDEYLVDVVAPTETRPNLSVGIKTDSHSSCSGPPCGGGDFGPACSPTETTTDSQEGTSFAAPQVAGVAALIRSRFPGLSQSQVKQRIKRSAQHYWGTRPTYEHGYGKVNAYRALTEWGKISSSVTWNVSGTRDGKYYVSGDITIENEGSLTIGPGVFIKVAPDHEAAGTDPTKVRIIVKDGGALYINGSEGAPVVFESFNEGPAGQTDWSGIEFQEGSSGAIAHAVFRNADRALELYTPMILQNVTIENGGTGIEHYEDLIISDSNIHDLAGSGIIIRGGELTASNVEISECGSYGISDALAHGRVLIEDCVIFDLGGNGIGLTWPATTIAISGTTIDNAGDTGILLGQPASVIGCGIQGCDIGIWFITSGSVSIRESTISNNTTAGIYVVGSANVIIDEGVPTV